MANHAATKKDARQNAKRRIRNRYYGKTMRNAVRELQDIQEKNVAVEKMPKVISLIDKLAKNGVIHRNKAANLKSKLVKRVNAVQS